MNTSELLTALVNTVMVCGLCMLVAVPLGTLLAIGLRRSDVPGRRWAWIAISSQLAVPLYVIAGSWSAGLGLQGWLRFRSSSLDWLSVDRLSGGMEAGLGSLLAVSAIHSLAAIPWVVLIVSLGLTRAHRGQEEAALIEGGNWHFVRYGLLPRLRLWLAASCLWCAVPVLTEMVVTNLYQVPTVAEQVYLDATQGSFSPWTYVASVWLCLLPILAVGIWLSRYAPPWREVIAGIAQHPGRVITLGPARWLWAIGLWVVVALIVGLPIVNLIIKAGWQPTLDVQGHSQYGWSVSRFSTTIYESLTLYYEHFYWSSMLALGATAVALTAATALSAVAGRGHLRTAVNLLALSMVAVPGPLAGILIISIMNRNSPAWLGHLYDNTLTAPILAQQFRLFPLAWLLSQAIVAGISPRAWEQAAVDGLTGMQKLVRIIAPHTWQQWLVAVLILVVMSVGELSCSILVLPPGVATLSMRMFEMLHFGMRHQDSGLCGLLLVLGWLVALLSWKTLKDR
ncbi:MAG: iron ABC transporter permease [Pirellulaceae bacterium]|nr:iron ABC transporter permease [Pirellulaceae bacterium]